MYVLCSALGNRDYKPSALLKYQIKASYVGINGLFENILEVFILGTYSVSPLVVPQLNCYLLSLLG